MKLGFGLITCQRYPGDPRSDEELYAEALDLAVEAERLGFDSVWVSEHHFVDDAYMPSLLPMCAAIAARTDRIAIGTGLLLAPLFEPIRLAEDAAVVDLISKGRLILGLGLGWREEEFDAIGVPLRERVPRLLDTVGVLRQAWSGTAVTGGDAVSYPDVFVTPTPSRPGGPPIWIGAISEQAVRRAGSVGDGFMATDVTPESFAEQVAWVRDELERAGRGGTPFTISACIPTFVHDRGPDEAWELIRSFHHYGWWKYEEMETARSSPGPPRLPPSLTTEEELALRSRIVLGTPDRVAEDIGRFSDAAGGDVHVIARLYWPGMQPDLQRETMSLFASQVGPLLR